MSYSSFVMKCYSSGFSHFSNIQGESVWEKRETSLCKEEVVKALSNNILSRDEMVVCFFFSCIGKL